MVLESVHVRVYMCPPMFTGSETAQVRRTGQPNRLLNRLASYCTECHMKLRTPSATIIVSIL